VPLPSLGRFSTRSNLKAVNPGRHRNALAKEAETEVEDHELTSYLAALAPDCDPESTGSGKRFGEAQVYQLRVSLIASEQLKDIAAERGTSPHALAQEWILERLSWEGQAASAQQRRHEEAHTDEFHLDQKAWDQPIAGGRWPSSPGTPELEA
jgi:aryl-alcohol dehydrogenase-like predicted oxidoreductase